MFGNMLSGAFNTQNTQPMFQSWGQNNPNNSNDSNNTNTQPNQFSWGVPNNQNTQNSALNFKGTPQNVQNNTAALSSNQNPLNRPNNMVQNNQNFGNFGQTSYLFPPSNQKQFQYEMYRFLDVLADKITLSIIRKNNQSLNYWEKMTGEAPKTDKNIKNVVLQELVRENNLSINQLFKYYQQRQRMNSNRINNATEQGNKQEIHKKSMFKSDYYDKIRSSLKQYGSLYNTDQKKGFIFDDDDNFDAEPKREIRLKQVEYHPQKINITEKAMHQAKMKKEREEYRKFQEKVLEQICVKNEQLPKLGCFIISPQLEKMKQFHHTKMKNIPDVQLRNLYGQVKFLEPINLYKKVIDEGIEIKQNSIEIKDPEWVNKKCQITLFNFGEFADLPDKVKKMIKEENQEDDQQKKEEEQKKVRRKKKLMRKRKYQERLEKAQAEFYRTVKKWALDNKYKIKQFDTQSGNLTLQL